MVDWMAIAGTALQFGLNGILYASTSEATRQLWEKFWDRLDGNKETRDALRAVERDRSSEALAQLQPGLAEAMEADPTFADEVQALVEQLKLKVPTPGEMLGNGAIAHSSYGDGWEEQREMTMLEYWSDYIGAIDSGELIPGGAQLSELACRKFGSIVRQQDEQKR